MYFGKTKDIRFNMKKIFLGGTANGSQWRDLLIGKLKADYLFPKAEGARYHADADFTKDLETCDFLLTVVTPLMVGFDDIFLLIDDSNKRSTKTIFCFLPEDGETKFSPHQIKSLNATGKMVEQNGGYWAKSLDEVAEYIQKKLAV